MDERYFLESVLLGASRIEKGSERDGQIAAFEDRQYPESRHTG